MKKICVIDYDSGNIKSVYNALRMVLVGSKNSIVVSSEKEKIKEASHIILPGVGSFNTCIEGLKKKKFIFYQSPIGKGLIGKNNGDFVEINTPSGKKNFEIIKVDYV